MRTTDHRQHPKPGARAASWASTARPLLLLAGFLASAVALLIVPPAIAPALAQGDSDQGREARDGGGSGEEGSGNGLGVIVDIPEGWPLNDKGGGHDIVRFEKCFPFCNVERPDGGSSGGQEGGETVIQEGTGEQTSIITQTQTNGETDEGETDDGSTDDEPAGGNDGGNDGDNGGGGEDQPEEPTISEETTVLEETTTFEGTTAPPGGTAECPTGPSGPISEVTLTQVLDADTLQVEGSDGNAYTVRLIGAEAPDLTGGGAEGGENEPGAEEAATFAREALGGQGQKLELEYDEQKTDENGQTFAYVWMENPAESPGPATQQLLDTPEVPGPVLFNRQLVESGYARAATGEPNTDYADCLAQAEEAARADEAGLWAEQASSPGAGPDAGDAGTVAGMSRASGVETVSIELASSKTPQAKPGDEAGANAAANDRAGAKESAIPPITRHAKAPEAVTPRAAHPGLAVGLAAAILAASLLAAVAIRRGGPVGTTEGSAN